MSAKKGRSYEKTFEVAAPVEAVWKAITEGEELTRWFCKEATCEAGVGGKQHIDWGGGAKGTAVITVWEPGVHLRTEALRPDLSRPERPEPYAIDWYLEHEGGVTRVRMVASGFGEGPAMGPRVRRNLLRLGPLPQDDEALPGAPPRPGRGQRRALCRARHPSGRSLGPPDEARRTGQRGEPRRPRPSGRRSGS